MSVQKSSVLRYVWSFPLVPATNVLQGVFVKYIQQETGTRVQIKGLGSGFVEQETGRESDEPLHIHITYVSYHASCR